MSIRTKLLLVLVGFAIVPMVIAFGVGQLSTRLVGARLSERTQTELVDEAEDRLLRFVSSASAIAGAQALTVELVVAAQATALARALEEAEPGDLDPSSLYFSRADFDRGERTPPGLETPPQYAGPDGGGHAVTFETPSILLALGVRREEVALELAAHQRLAEAYRLLNEYDPGLLLFQYACTATGVHSAYPGHGGYPEGYEPRERSWYRLPAGVPVAEWANPHGVFWGPPIVDAATGQAVLTVSAPVRLSDGSLAGVTAVDIRVVDLMEEIARKPVWTRDERIVVASLLGEGGDPSIGDTSLAVYAQRAYDDGAGDWRRTIDMDTFRLDDDETSRAMVAAIAAGQRGVLRARRDGREVFCAYAPIQPGEDDSAAALVYTVPFDEVVRLAEAIDREFWDITLRQLLSNAAIALVVLAAVVVFAFRGSRAVTDPVRRLAEAVGRVAQGDLDARAEVDRSDELGQLARDFNDMTPALRDRLRLRHSLDLAMEVQQSLLPNRSPALEGFDIEGRSVYCDETGGDYYDYLLMDESEPGRLGVALGDVTGHGVAAALLMTTARALLRSRVSLPGAIGHQLTDINRHLSADNEHGRFMTLFYLLVDAREGVLRWSTAGHDPAIVYEPAGDRFTELDGDNGGIPLGVVADWTYGEGQRDIPPHGSIVLLGTDGIWEQRNEAREMFGKERLREVIRRHAGEPAGAIGDAVLRAVGAFRGATPQADDITLVVIKRLGA